MWLLIIVGIILIGIGLGVHVFKWYFLISGYNTMSKEKKEKVDIKGLARLLGIYAYINGGLFILAGGLYGLELKWLTSLVIIFFATSTIYILIRGQKFDKHIFHEDGTLRKGAWKQMALPMGIVVISLIFVACVMFFSLKPSKISIMDDGLQIHGMYGNLYRWESIEQVQLKDTLPSIQLRTNGSAIGSKLKGHFKTKELGSVKLFVDADNPPFIYLYTDNGTVIFNLIDINETQALYQEILDKLSMQ
ncbi:DUF3784 domain-containing protein [Herbinix luporum]|jgi:hypothetical protein|uniref:DUF3784 domain-containing protein n=1 Tax=Herbinix luporum TaxID=1679721 RepID=UPI001770415E|nr:DUF3784 domain-containing protein [Herbinix luporum]HHT56857.1 DUF3784 domain-containing protein [Herbinix luporum]